MAMERASILRWYAAAALFGIVAAVIAAAVAILWIGLGIDDRIAALGVPAWFGHGIITVATIGVIGLWVRRVRAPH